MAEKTVEQFYLPPPKVGKWESFSTFLWNSETSQFMGRTGSSWAKILLFYAIFYACLCGFFAGLLLVFYQTLDMHVPKWQQDASLIGNNPGLGFRPLPPGDNVESTLIWYRTQESRNYEIWTNELDQFLAPYHEKSNVDGTGEGVVKCDYDLPPGPGKVCQVDMRAMGPCTKENKYNYPRGGPCIFLKINKIYGWIPDYYNTTEKLPKNMPNDLKDTPTPTPSAQTPTTSSSSPKPSSPTSRLLLRSPSSVKDNGSKTLNDKLFMWIRIDGTLCVQKTQPQQGKGVLSMSKMGGS